jgi:hypothetical protein
MMLANDDPEGAKVEASDAMNRWSRRGFHLQHYNALFSRVTASLYEGDAEAAETLVTEAWPAMKKAMVFFIQQMKIRALHLRGCTRVASAKKTNARYASLLQLAEDDAQALDGEKVAWARALAMLLRAGIKHSSADTAGAANELARAIAALDQADMSLYAAAARRQLGAIQGGNDGAALVAQADSFMRERQILNPKRLAAMLVPGLVTG